MIWIGTVGIVIATVIAGLFADRKWGLLPRKERLQRLASSPRLALPAHAAGEAPATALRVSPSQIETLRRTQRCCGAVMELLPDDEVAFGGGTLAILRFRCASCATIKSIYVQRIVE